MSVKLIYSSPLALISSAIHYSHSNHHLSDTDKRRETYIEDCLEFNSDIDTLYKENLIGEKDFNLIKKVGFHMNHSSTLEHSLIVFDVKMSTKALLEESRHRVGVSQTVTSSRYALDVVDIEYEKTNDETINAYLGSQIQGIEDLMDNYRNDKGKISKKDMDNLAMLLPQAFIYRMQLTFNLRSLVHFLELRMNASAHWTIRRIAYEIINTLDNDYRELMFENQKIKKDYELYERR